MTPCNESTIAVASPAPAGMAGWTVFDGARAEGEAGDDERGERQRLEQAQQLLPLSGPAGAAPVQHRKGDDRRRGHRRPMAPGRRHQHAEVLADDHSDRGRGPGGADPVAPADDEAGVAAEGPTHENVLPARPGDHRGELGHRDGPEQRVDAARDPDGEKERGGGQAEGDVAGSAEDADADGVADDDRDAERGAQDTEQLSRLPRRRDDLRNGQAPSQ